MFLHFFNLASFVKKKRLFYTIVVNSFRIEGPNGSNSSNRSSEGNPEQYRHRIAVYDAVNVTTLSPVRNLKANSRICDDVSLLLDRT